MYIVEGNIGAGKSTFLRLLKKTLPHIGISPEPITDWQRQVYGQSLLTNFYEDPARWAYTFETLTLMCRTQDHVMEQSRTNSIQVVERSIYSGFYCFAENSYESGFMSDIEWKLYREWFAFLIQNKCAAPTGFIYLKVDPEIAYERIKKRNRYAEKTISRAYLKQIHARHEQFLVDKVHILAELKEVPVLQLDCNSDFENNPTLFGNHILKLEDFFAKTYGVNTLKTHTNVLITPNL